MEDQKLTRSEQLKANLQTIEEARKKRDEFHQSVDIDFATQSDDVLGSDGTVLPLNKVDLTYLMPFKNIETLYPDLTMDSPEATWFFSPTQQCAGIRICSIDGQEQSIFLLPPFIVQLLTELRTEVQTETALQISNAVKRTAEKLFKGE